MKQITREEWTAALRSGAYAQTMGMMYRADDATQTHSRMTVGYCCLGVACALAEVPAHAFHNASTSHFADLSWRADDGGKVNAGQIAVWLGLDMDDCSKLADANDNRDLNFAAIADMVDSMPFKAITLDADGLPSETLPDAS